MFIEETAVPIRAKFKANEYNFPCLKVRDIDKDHAYNFSVLPFTILLKITVLNFWCKNQMQQ